MARKPLISIAIPAYNESANIDELWSRLTSMFEQLNSEYDFEVVVCENGSRDDTFEKLTQIKDVDSRLKIVQLSRNFHMEGGMLAALSEVSGDACVIMSADLQDPPEMIPEMIQKWRSGFDHVYTVITHRHGESKFRQVAAEVFYWMIDRISDTPVPRNASDFRLVDKQMYQAFNALPEKDRMVRAVWGWVGFHSTNMEYERPARTGGTSSFNPFVTGAFAIRGMFASSLKPLKLIPIAGLTLSGVSFIALVIGIIRTFIDGVPSPGFGTITSLILLMFGLLFLLLSVLAEYIGMIYIEARSRPTYIVKRARPDFDQ
ncbi:MAG: glycosyltransferase [Betaproteobacteria bacterium]|nr:glycosyltransferase [Betaproteobacteria bacterium]NBT68985.1 glycosyltransferase [Betaproteobacteria bacterium]